MWGRGPRGNSAACSTLHQISVTSSATHNQTGPLCYPQPNWCWFPSGWACVCSRTLWVSPVNSLVRLGVSPTAASTPRGVFNLRFEAGSFSHQHNPHRFFTASSFESLVSHTETLGFVVCLAPPLFLLANLHTNVKPPMQSASLPAVRPSLSVCKCGAAGCYPPLCLPRSLPL